MTPGVRRVLTKRGLIVSAVVIASYVAIAWLVGPGSPTAAPRLATASLDTIRQTVSATGTGRIPSTQRARSASWEWRGEWCRPVRIRTGAAGWR